MPRRTKRALKHRRKNRTRRHKSRRQRGGWGEPIVKNKQ